MIKGIYEKGAGSQESTETASVIEKIDQKPENQPIDPKDFVGVSFFDEEEVKRDIYLVEEKRNKILNEKSTNPIQNDAHISANFVEVAVPEAIKELGWLGKKVKVIKPSLYDDFFRGIDNVIQILPDEEVRDQKWIRCIGFSMDFTIDKEAAKNKAIEEMIAIKKGKVPAMKYFKTDIMTTEGQMEIKLKNFKIPKVIMLCPKEIMDESKNDLLHFEINPDDEYARKKAEDCVFKYYFMKESLAQLEFFATLAGMVGNKAAEDTYKNSLESFRHILKEQGIDEDFLEKKVGRYSGLIGKDFDLEADSGKFLTILEALSKQPEKISH